MRHKLYSLAKYLIDDKFGKWIPRVLGFFIGFEVRGHPYVFVPLILLSVLVVVGLGYIYIHPTPEDLETDQS